MGKKEPHGNLTKLAIRRTPGAGGGEKMYRKPFNNRQQTYCIGKLMIISSNKLYHFLLYFGTKNNNNNRKNEKEKWTHIGSAAQCRLPWVSERLRAFPLKISWLHHNLIPVKFNQLNKMNLTFCYRHCYSFVHQIIDLVALFCFVLSLAFFSIVLSILISIQPPKHIIFLCVSL